jgi:pyruvate/2-oxoglutarate dehydrogenase complex dihydrolipoamide dehydrogenase (E3) component
MLRPVVAVAELPGSWLEVDDTCMVRALEDGWLYALGMSTTTPCLRTRASTRPAPPGSLSTPSRGAGTPSPRGAPGVLLRPPAGAVGLTADQAERAGHRIRVVDVDPGVAVPGAGLYADRYTGRARMVADKDYGCLLGVTFVGPGVEELIHSATIAVAGQVPISRLWHAVPCCPSISEVWLRLLEAYRN